jgi:hypothetical protein
MADYISFFFTYIPNTIKMFADNPYTVDTVRN